MSVMYNRVALIGLGLIAYSVRSRWRNVGRRR